MMGSVGPYTRHALAKRPQGAKLRLSEYARQCSSIACKAKEGEPRGIPLV